jgi:hypothetical protein
MVGLRQPPDCGAPREPGDDCVANASQPPTRLAGPTIPAAHRRVCWSWLCLTAKGFRKKPAAGGPQAPAIQGSPNSRTGFPDEERFIFDGFIPAWIVYDSDDRNCSPFRSRSRLVRIPRICGSRNDRGVEK